MNKMMTMKKMYGRREGENRIVKQKEMIIE